MYTIVYKGSQEVRFFRVWALLTRSKKHFCFVFGLTIVTKDLIDVSLSYFSHHGYDEKVTVALSFRRIRGSLRVDHFWSSPGASISRNLWGSNLTTRTFFSEISRNLFALFVHRRFCLQCLYVAIAHLMQFFSLFGVMPFRKWGNKRTVFWKKKAKKLIAVKSGLVGMKGLDRQPRRFIYPKDGGRFDAPKIHVFTHLLRKCFTGTSLLTF